MPVLPGLTFDDAIGFSDAELERRLDGLVHKVDAHDGNLADDLWP
jgi:hypothetical protein